VKQKDVLEIITTLLSRAKLFQSCTCRTRHCCEIHSNCTWDEIVLRIFFL